MVDYGTLLEDQWQTLPRTLESYMDCHHYGLYETEHGRNGRGHQGMDWTEDVWNGRDRAMQMQCGRRTIVGNGGSLATRTEHDDDRRS